MSSDAAGAKVDLGVLEEDDEFEEFPVDGTFSFYCCFIK